MDGADAAFELMEAGDGETAIIHLVHWLASRRLALGTAAWRAFASTVVNHPVARYVYADPFTHRAYTKPRGYAGDAVMMDYIYGFERAELAPASAAVTEYTTQLGRSPRGVRFRREELARTIDSVAASHDGDIRVLAIAAGHFREADLSKAVQDGSAAVVALDHDTVSLEVVMRSYSQLNVVPVVGSVRRILARRQRLVTSDLVYSAGLYDYLTDPVAARLTQALFDAVAPGGRLLIANFLPDLPDVGYMESFMDWHLVYRDEAQMRTLVDHLPTSNVAAVRQYRDPFDAVTYLEVTRR